MKEEIIQEGNIVLRQIAKPILKKEFGAPTLLDTIKRMRSAVKNEKLAVAIAAPQIGVLQRIFIIASKVFDIEEIDNETGEVKTIKGHDKVFINPEIVRISSKKKNVSEGCLSVREKYGTVVRYDKVTVRAYDEHGEPFTYHGSDLIAQIFQHEVDHLNGILFIDKAKNLHSAE